MSASTLANLLKLLGTARDGALLRFSIGNEYLKADDPGPAIEHLQQATSLDPQYSAAWKLLGKALTLTHRPAEALQAYRQGISVAQARGDKQAAKEMGVFAARLEKQLGAAGD